ncbi:LacI family transcriptional regulator [Verrucomicrobia bacterium LW23]|nr:LacI family transcriptional regulator [Verrucomicrobia bacterium LW23]
MNQPRVTLRDIAAAAGLHFSTVSLALRDHPRISPGVRQKVKDIAQSMGYAPDPVLSALNAYRNSRKPAQYKSTVAWVDNWPADTRMRDQSTFEEYFQGASQRARELGYEIEEFPLQVRGMTPARASHILHSRGIKGLLLAPQPDFGVELPLKYELFSSVTFGYSLMPQSFHLVTNHQFHTLMLSLRELQKLGYKRIGFFVHETVNDKVDSSYLSAYFFHCYKNPGVKHPEPVIIPRNTKARGLLLDWWKKEKPEAIITSLAWETLEWLRELGLEAPRDYGYVYLSVPLGSPMTGVYQSGPVIGRAAMDMLAGLLQRGEVGHPETPMRLLVEGHWNAGTTVRQQ